ncbi:hypothetical protein BEP19_09580 [Ammoniphilus oxalaticus]|uniref:YugN-like family protein n=1 Tax=Ammoniphilus oxalaticus TaxID=66863 RepID=A0A419SKT2_9BACL|nr:YugN family protein [Ammoniphilus oxalaticus]RKD24614.1 hypothetical protein BEP19_09580 [Ammoniphilus oxalaticus]
MISFQSEIEGKEAQYGAIAEPFATEGFVLGGNWDYDGGYFDCALEKDGDGETIYLRLPAQVTRGQLDDAKANLKFLQPLLVRHVVHTGIADEVGSAGTLNQFQSPIETDGEIHAEDHRVAKAEQAIQRIMPFLS